MLRFQHTAMATQFEIRCTHPDEHYARSAALAAFAAVDRLELLLSRFVENSDISRLNARAPDEEVVVSLETHDCLKLAELMFRETDGAFDPTLGRGTAVDLGAIGKGYAVDRMAAILEDWDVRQALIDAGQSSVVALDPPEGESHWALSLSDPRDPVVTVARIDAVQRVLGASGIRKPDHIIDPMTGEPVRARRAAWVSAPRQLLGAISLRAGVTAASPAAIADALSTAFMMSAPDIIEAWRRAHPELDIWILQ